MRTNVGISYTLIVAFNRRKEASLHLCEVFAFNFITKDRTWRYSLDKKYSFSFLCRKFSYLRLQWKFSIVLLDQSCFAESEQI